MIEIFNIIIQLIIFLLIFSIGNFSLVKKINYNKSYNLYENYSINIVIQLNIILFLSFFNFNLEMIIYSYLIFIIFLTLINLKSLFLKEKFFNNGTYFLAFICLIIFFNIAFNLTLSWDTEKFYFNKVLNFYNGFSIDNIGNTNRSYNPFFGDLIWAFFWEFSLISKEYAGRLFYGFFYILSVSFLVSNLKIKDIHKFLIILLIILSTYDYRILLSGNKEVLIFSLLCLMLNNMNNLTLNIPKKENKDILLFIFTANLLMWSKQVGFIYLISLILPLVFLFKLRYSKKIIIILSCLFFYFLKIYIYNFYNFDVNLKTCCFDDFSIDGIINKISIERLSLVLSYLIFYLFQNFVFIIGFVFLLLGIMNRIFLKNNLYLYWIIVINFISIITIYTLTDANLDLMLRTGIERLSFMFMPAFLMLIINYVNFFSKKTVTSY